MTGHLKASPPERYEEISRHLLEQAQEELDKGDILQASEKAWGATAHAVKAHSQQRGWNHHAHYHLRYAANCIAIERDRRDLMTLFGFLEAIHINYYEHQKKASEVRNEINNAVVFTREMAMLRMTEPPGSQEHITSEEINDLESWLQTLTRKTQASHGPQFDGAELAGLPPVKPPPNPV